MMTMPSSTSRKPSGVPTRRASAPADETGPVVDLERYVPAFLTWIANKLSRGASQAYLAAFDVGIETWRILVLLAIHRSISAQGVSRIIGMDKASVSRAFKSMQARSLITIGLDGGDGRVRLATITAKGRKLHDQIFGVALERERAFLSVLSPAETDTLIGLLHRLHDNLPAVEQATERHLAAHFPNARRRKASETAEEDEA